jgi:hypothetical protein
MALTHCSTCGTDLGGRSICPRCGTLIGVEAAITRIQTKAKRLIDSWLAALPAFGPAHFLWVGAVIPVVIAPPLVSLGIAIASMRRRSGNIPPVDFEWIAIVSAINIVVSGLILYRFHFSPAELAGYFGDIMRDWLGKFWNVLPGSKPASPRIIPI